jgi:hypothetical protein
MDSIHAHALDGEGRPNLGVIAEISVGINIDTISGDEHSHLIAD